MQEETLDYLEEQWSYWRAGFPFTYFFVGDSFDEQYATEERLGQVFGYFSLLAIIIAALGLFGLASFTAQQRVKEIGIRKVLGASVGSIVLNLSKRFTMLVLLAFVIAIPIAYIAMQQWLQGFAYQMDISPKSFLLAGGGAIMVAWLTISYQSVKAAMTNPVNSLRSE